MWTKILLKDHTLILMFGNIKRRLYNYFALSIENNGATYLFCSLSEAQYNIQL